MDVAMEPPLAVLRLVSDANRWRLLSELSRSDRRVSELIELTGAPQNLVSYHLSALREAGLVTARRSAADRRDTYYRADLLACRALFDRAASALHPSLSPAHQPALAQPHRPAPLRRPLRRRPRVVLFLCTGNSARSQMAAAFLERECADAVQVLSAGSHPKPLHPQAVAVMAERGIDIAGRASTHLDRYRRRRIDLVITLCDRVRETCPPFPGAAASRHWSVPDPSVGATATATRSAVAAARESGQRDPFVAAATEISERVLLLADELRATTGT
jgi:ArsR family transcriptional regulator, arsenate/arsenite/antimonite-responsive transcriptional repressor / arsenate reductase (thioredoxin)